MIRYYLVVFATFVITGCGASIQTISSAPPIPYDKCQVKVFSSLESAEKKGDIEELCIISGTSSGSFSHTVSTAINKHKNRACQCGANNVYIQTQDAGTLGTASVTLVSFRYLNERGNTKAKSGIFELAKKCQNQGGVWVNDVCQLMLEE